MIHVTFTSVRATPDRMGMRYVRAVVKNEEYFWCIVDAKDKRYDVVQGTCGPHDLPTEIRETANNLFGFVPCYVEWPR